MEITHCIYIESGSTYTGDRLAAWRDLVNCTLDRCNWPNRACRLRNRRPNRMCAVAFWRRTYFGISVCDVRAAGRSPLVRIDPNRWCPLVCDTFDPCNIQDKIVREFRLVLRWTNDGASAELKQLFLIKKINIFKWQFGFSGGACNLRYMFFRNQDQFWFWCLWFLVCTVH